MISDSLYGTLDLPNSARRLAETCPLLLRLREIRMPNIGFLEFPGFATVTRYEHSLGVAHLTWWWARRNGLDDDLGEALTLGALYHDAATPAFSHLFEEFLSRSGFNHERALVDALSPSSSYTGGVHTQVFLGRSARLRDELASRRSECELMTARGVAELAAGIHPLGRAVHGDMDLDNIDNVIRATRAMGISSNLRVHPYEVAQALTWEDNELRLSPGFRLEIGQWKELRRRLYRTILDSKREFEAQTAIKWAIQLCYESDVAMKDPEISFSTEPELIWEHLRQHERSRVLIDAARLGDFPELVCSAWVDDISALVGNGSERVTFDLCDELGQIWGREVYVNFYVDKRERPIKLRQVIESTLFGEDEDQDEVVDPALFHPPDARLPGVVGVVSRPTQSPVGGRSTRVSGDSHDQTRVALSNSIGPLIRYSPRWLGARK